MFLFEPMQSVCWRILLVHFLWGRAHLSPLVQAGVPNPCIVFVCGRSVAPVVDCDFFFFLVSFLVSLPRDGVSVHTWSPVFHVFSTHWHLVKASTTLVQRCHNIDATPFWLVIVAPHACPSTHTFNAAVEHISFSLYIHICSFHYFRPPLHASSFFLFSRT